MNRAIGECPLNPGAAGIRPLRPLSILALWVLAAFFVLPARAQIQGGEPLSAQLTATGLEVTGATAGGEVAIFGVWRQRRVYWSEVGRVDERLLDDDGDGEVAWDLGKPIPTATVLFAVDVGSGEWVTAAPQSFGLRPLPPERWAVSPEGTSLSVESRLLQLLWIRPSEGGWSGTAMDGGLGDSATSADGALAISIGEIPATGGDSSLTAPQQLTPGDLLFGVDTASLKFFVHEAAGGEG